MEIRQLQPALARREFSLSRSHAHLILLESGSVQLRDSGRELTGPQAVWVPWQAHEMLRLEAGARALLLGVTRLALVAIDGLAGVGQLLTPLSDRNLYAALTPAEWQRLALLCEIVREETARPSGDSRPRIEAAGSLILTGFLRLVRPDASQVGTKLPLADRFMFLAAQHLHEHWGVNDYAKALGVTRFQLGDAVQRQLGRKPQAYLQEQWVNQAMALLRQPQMRVAAVGYRVGFQDPAYFSRAFKAAVGQTPRAWREALREGRVQSFAAWP